MTVSRSSGSDGRWRPRKKEFERLDGEEDSFLRGDDDDPGEGAAPTATAWPIQNVFSTESDAGEYKREIFYERKRKVLRQQMEAQQVGPSSSSALKRELSAFSIQRPVKDTTGGSATKKKKKLTSTTATTTTRREVDPFSDLAMASSFSSDVDAFGFNVSRHSHADDESSRHTHQTSSTKHTFSQHTSHHTVTSDPSDFFSKEMTAGKLTKNNLARMAAMTEEPETRTNNTSHNNKNKNTFYQFALDSDRESTVVESTVQLPMSYSEEGEEDYSKEDDDDTECSDGVASTQIQVCAPKPTMDTTKNERFFVEESTQKESSNNAFKPEKRQQSIYGDDGFGSFSGKSDVKTSSNDFFAFSRDGINDSGAQRSQSPPPALPLRGHRQQSTHSLAYSPSPVHKNLSQSKPSSDRTLRDARFPLSPLSNLKSSSHNKNGVGHNRRPKSQRSSPLVPSSNTKGTPNDGFEKKPDPVEAWTAGFKSNSSKHQLNRPDPVPEFDPFGSSGAQEIAAFGNGTAVKKKRDPSMSTIVNARFSTKASVVSDTHEPFESLDRSGLSNDPFHQMEMNISDNNLADNAWRFEDLFAPFSTEDGSRKENFTGLANHNQASSEKATVTAIPSSDLVPKHRQPLILGDSDDEDDDEDSFDSVALWERSGRRTKSKPIGIKNFPPKSGKRTSIASSSSKNSQCSRSRFNGNEEEAHRNPPEGLDNKSVSSRASSVAGGSFTKPLALPSNAIMASMLFQKHYNIDKNDVEKKIKAKEEEYSKNRNSRTGDIPDSIQADHDYMTTVSSFSDVTPTTFSDAWRKPSRDLLDYFSSTRTLDADSKTYLASQRTLVSKSVLFEA